ncbi:MAG: hypothetical protein SWO11_03330 [Thermodesulfobacteriota bacterium]|nr:hypothetical protein [Thermodesulfobacteriota bacterium]
MKYCPNCKSEYVEQIEQCFDCNIKLISESEYLHMEDVEDAKHARHKELDKLYKVCILENPFEADLVSDALEKEGIAYVVREYQDTAYDGLFMTQLGWGAIFVPHAEVKKAKMITDEIKKSIKEENSSPTNHT